MSGVVWTLMLLLWMMPMVHQEKILSKKNLCTPKTMFLQCVCLGGRKHWSLLPLSQTGFTAKNTLSATAIAVSGPAKSQGSSALQRLSSCSVWPGVSLAEITATATQSVRAYAASQQVRPVPLAAHAEVGCWLCVFPCE
uniref:leucine-rich colipase-like protein 1 isoform X1 n=1 Tax=Jaculus jaculus TaxID=51337 RepID=UPI001E1B100E|nr:leucine-rich colipase-like protein 1 isoform X1 [Jaculus jaculus]XP_045012650.1 leucine-rich colipase-like protein 1 isoform X1 [Jaculus jaculus]